MKKRKITPHTHPFLKLGKAPARRDRRNFKLTAVLKPMALPSVPAKWDFDLDYAKTPIPTPVFANDRIGDCVMAGRAHMTLRFELFEQGKLLPIKDDDVIREYKREGGSMDPNRGGLVMLDSLNEWRRTGWKIAGRKYTVHAFVELDRGSAKEIKTAIRYLNGAYVGLSLPDCFLDQFQRGQAWDIVPGPKGRPNRNNGHCVYLCGYTSKGPVCVTWGKKQPMTWKFFTACCDEAYAIADNRDPFVKHSPIDLGKLDSLLNQL
jgi:hypothetical protein